MSGSNIDKQIQQLLSIKLGLQQQSDKLFKQLLPESGIKDPLDSIYKTIMQKNMKIQKLQKKIVQIQQQLNKYKTGSQKSTISNQYKSNSPDSKNYNLPSSHQQDMKNHRQKLEDATIHKDRYRKRIQEFVIFLMKCLRQISRAQINRPDKFEKMIDKFQKSLQNQTQRIVEDSDSKNKYKNNSQVSTGVNQSPQNNLKNIVKYINEKKEPQQVLTAICGSLGLQNLWNNYITPLKQKIQLYEVTKNQILKLQENGLQKPSFPLQKGSQFQRLMKQKFNWNVVVEKAEIQVKQKIQNERQNSLNQLLVDRKKQIQAIPQKAFGFIKSIIKFFYESLDEMFTKHNQYPFQCSQRASFISTLQNVQKLILQSLWPEAQNALKAQIKEAFYMIQRKTKFYSNNRILIRNNL